MTENIVVQNAIIKSAWISKPEHGCLSVCVVLNYGVTEQMVSSRPFQGDWHKGIVRFIDGLLECAGVNDWTSLPGHAVRVEGTSIKVSRIGHIVESIWFDLDKDSSGNQD